MSDGERAEAREGSFDSGLLLRLWRAIELLVSLQASAAKREATADAKRILAALAMVLVALGLFGFAAVLAHAALILEVQRRFALGYGSATGVVAGADVGVAIVLLAVAKGKLSAPVLSETRAMVKKAAAALRP